ncbi:hypothetical protein ACFWOJ_34785 [Streptomyces sp. NPDC058439]|uniref:hypothetical protein n=1 Tax=Streptomyces sp. NPDC058439 TaxID=3346500 RepID=UPI00364B92A2
MDPLDRRRHACQLGHRDSRGFARRLADGLLLAVQEGAMFRLGQLAIASSPNYCLDGSVPWPTCDPGVTFKRAENHPRRGAHTATSAGDASLEPDRTFTWPYGE